MGDPENCDSDFKGRGATAPKGEDFGEKPKQAKSASCDEILPVASDILTKKSFLKVFCYCKDHNIQCYLIKCHCIER